MPETETMTLFTEIELGHPLDDATRRRLDAFAGETRGFPGNLDFRVFRDVNRPTALTVFETWRDAATFGAHRSSAVYRTFQDEMTPLVAAPVAKAITLTMVDEIAAATAASAEPIDEGIPAETGDLPVVAAPWADPPPVYEGDAVLASDSWDQADLPGHPVRPAEPSAPASTGARISRWFRTVAGLRPE